MKARVHPAAVTRSTRKGNRKSIRIDKTDLILGFAWDDRPELSSVQQALRKKTTYMKRIIQNKQLISLPHFLVGSTCEVDLP
jgi:hypothetical protein